MKYLVYFSLVATAIAVPVEESAVRSKRGGLYGDELIGHSAALFGGQLAHSQATAAASLNAAHRLSQAHVALQPAADLASRAAYTLNQLQAAIRPVTSLTIKAANGLSQAQAHVEPAAHLALLSAKKQDVNRARVEAVRSQTAFHLAQVQANARAAAQATAQADAAVQATSRAQSAFQAQALLARAQSQAAISAHQGALRAQASLASHILPPLPLQGSYLRPSANSLNPAGEILPALPEYPNLLGLSSKIPSDLAYQPQFPAASQANRLDSSAPTTIQELQNELQNIASNIPQPEISPEPRQGEPSAESASAQNEAAIRAEQTQQIIEAMRKIIQENQAQEALQTSQTQTHANGETNARVQMEAIIEAMQGRLVAAENQNAVQDAQVQAMQAQLATASQADSQKIIENMKAVIEAQAETKQIIQDMKAEIAAVVADAGNKAVEASQVPVAPSASADAAAPEAASKSARAVSHRSYRTFW